MSDSELEPETERLLAKAKAKPNGPAPPLRWRAAAETKPKRTTWMWYPYLPGGVVSIIGAKGGSCKGLCCVHLAAAVTTGGPWPDGSGHAAQGSVLWCEAEDPLPEVVIPRLIAAGADLSQVFMLSRDEFAALNLRDAIKEKNFRLIVLSPMVSFLDLADLTRELDVRSVLERAQASIEGTDCVLLGIAHSNKKADLAAIERILGAVAFVNFVRSVLLTAPEKDDEGAYRLVHAKHNLSAKGDDLILRPVYVGEDPDRRDQFVRLSWSHPEDGNTDAAAVFDRKPAGNGPTAREWLRGYLREHGETKRDDVVIAGARAGFKEEALEKALSRDARLKSRREHFPNIAWWSAL